MPRAGTEIYDLFNSAYNLNQNDSWSRAFLFDQRVSPPGVPLVYEHAPNNLRLFGYVLLNIGLDNPNINSLALILIQILILATIFVKLFSEKELLIILPIFLLINCFDYYFLTKILNPLRLTQYLFYYYLISVVIKVEPNRNLKLIILFFLAWQTELVFALYLTIIYTIYIIINYLKNFKLMTKNLLVISIACGSSLLIFISQLLLYRGWSFISDWVNVTHTRNTILYDGWKRPLDTLSYDQISQLFMRNSDKLNYQIPLNLGDGIVHTIAMIFQRYDFFYHLIPLFIIISTIIILINRSRMLIIHKKIYELILYSIISFLLVMLVFRGYVAFLYLMLYEPLIDMIINLTLAINLGTLSYLYPIFRKIILVPITITIVICMYMSSTDRWESKINYAAPISSEMMRELLNIKYKNNIIYANFEDNYAIPGLINTHIVYYPLSNFNNKWGYPELMDYYVCSNSADICSVENLESKNFKIDLVYKDSSGIIFKIR